MHLSDEQLLEPNESGQLHIDQCEVCLHKMNNLNKMRQHFHSLSENSIATENWREIQKIQKERQQSLELKHTQKQLNRWKISSLALAASITAIMLWPVFQTTPKTPSVASQQLNQLIEQNRYLQQQLDDTSQYDYQTKVSYQLIQMDIQSVDQAIQRAYLQGADNELKSELWEKRKQLVNQLLSGAKIITTLRI